VNKYLDQPALTAAGDAVLARSLEHTNSAGAKIAFSISDAGHAYDQQMNTARANRGYAKQDVKAQRIGSKADLATAKRQRTIDRLHDAADTKTYRSDFKTSRDAARMQLKSDKPNLSARRQSYTAAQHAAGDNAYNPLGGMMTKKDGTSSSVGSLFKKNLAMDGSLKSASAPNDFSKVAAARALLSNLIEKVAEEQDGKKKTKEAVVPLNISSPSDSSGFQAQQLK
jgi:hypothetical protein